MSTRKQLLEKTADILEQLAEKCGGPGGKPGPCPLGGSGQTDGSKPRIARRKAGQGITSDMVEFEGDHPPIKLPGDLKGKTKTRIASQKKLASSIPSGKNPESDLIQRISGYEKLIKGEKIPNKQTRAIVADLMNQYHSANWGGGRTYAGSKPKSKYASDMLSHFGIDAAETYRRIDNAPGHTPVHIPK